jgi:hypothetical protein
MATPHSREVVGFIEIGDVIVESIFGIDSDVDRHEVCPADPANWRARFGLSYSSAARSPCGSLRPARI